MIFSSPLSRATQTSELINRHHGAEIELEESLVEIDFGDWEGGRYPDIFVQNKDQYYQWLTDPRAPIPGGESFFQVCERVRSFSKNLMDLDLSFILVVSHATVTRAILTHLFDLDLTATKRFRMRNCGLSKILIVDDPPPRRAILDSWNHVAGR
jgi:broad specificity phosphatase PhoE